MHKDNEKITPVILCGGKGRRLWPLSNSYRPKQFIPLINGKTMFTEALERCNNPDLFENALVVGSLKYQGLIKKFSPPNTKLILEAHQKNTGPAISMALHSLNENDIALILPSDHIIPDKNKFFDIVQSAIAILSKNKLIIFGIQPISAHTGYGYIQAGANNDNAYEVIKFHEKPDSIRAKNYIKTKSYYWNSGMLLGKVSVIMQEIQKQAHTMGQITKRAWDKRSEKEGIIIPDAEILTDLEPKSFDHAVLEKSKNILVLPTDLTWYDIGNWQALLTIKKQMNTCLKQR